MKKLISLLIVLAMLLPLFGLAEQSIAENEPDTITNLSAIDIVNALINAKYPVFSVVVYDEKTDSNGLLGRPNQYISKANALDLRMSSKASKDPSDIIVEVFSTEQDCETRVDYINSIYKQMPMFAMYMYPYSNALLRIDFDLLPSEAEEYRKAFTEIVSGEAVDIFKALPTANVSLAEDTSSKSNPALIGDHIFIKQDGKSFTLTLLYAFRGKAAAMFTKSFNKYNNSSTILPKGKEWLLLYLQIDGAEDSQYPINLSDFDFHIISENGADNGYSMLMDNPNPINSMYASGTQYCWFGMPVEKGDRLFLTFSDGYSDSYWFDLSVRQKVDTSALIYPEIAKKDTGETVEALQMMLVEYGYLAKLPSGKFDSNTISALKKFQKAVGMKATGTADSETLQRLFSGKPIADE